MVQFNGPHGKVTVSYLRQGGLNPPAPAPEGSFAGKTVVITGCSSGIVRFTPTIIDCHSHPH